MAATDTTAPLIQGLAWTITALSLWFCILRLFIKWKYRGKLWYDDYTLAASMAFLLVNTGLIQSITALGYGKHVKDIVATAPQNIRRIVMHLQFLSGVVRLSTNLARVSFGITLLQLSNEREKLFVWFAITTLLAVTTPAIILPFVSCIPYDKIFDPTIPGTCINEGVSIGYFVFEGAWTSLVDFSLVALPWRVLSRLQIRRVEKLGASIAMSLGVLSGVVTIIRTIHTNQIIDEDWTYTSAGLTIWNMVEPAAVIIAASLPNLRVFIVKNTANLKAGIKAGSKTRLCSRGKCRGKCRKADEIYLDKVQSTMKAISAGSATGRGEATAWITSRATGDDDSEKSILHNAGAIPSTGIVQTNTFAVEYPEETRPASTEGAG
ncbi:hypothetical protein SAMD00023353_7400420 [Rosellinia necatrix]|uniref:Rhodopsin domain-containing protein n=1 Tax=Rosellinia necatrix TaxID=77044 RepID=A0A1W2TT51_ROSNE|nr:hypothetical protein SAMD00023353_7400420 [Rosellinia necatrix]